MPLCPPLPHHCACLASPRRPPQEALAPRHGRSLPLLTLRRAWRGLWPWALSVHAYMCAWVHMQVCMRTCLCAWEHMHVCMGMCLCAWEHARVWECTRVPGSIYMRAWEFTHVPGNTRMGVGNMHVCRGMCLRVGTCMGGTGRRRHVGSLQGSPVPPTDPHVDPRVAPTCPLGVGQAGEALGPGGGRGAPLPALSPSIYQMKG